MSDPLVTCFCSNCKGKKEISKSLRRYHMKRVEAKQTSVRAANASHIPQNAPPIILSTFSQPSLTGVGTNSSTKQSIDVPPDHDPGGPYLSPSQYVEHQMLEHGTLTIQDINLQLFGSAMPYLGPNVTSPEELLADIDRQEASNAAALIAGIRAPLTAYEAHRDPYTKEDRRFARHVEEMYEAAMANVESENLLPGVQNQTPSAADMIGVDDEWANWRVDVEMDGTCVQLDEEEDDEETSADAAGKDGLSEALDTSGPTTGIDENFPDPFAPTPLSPSEYGEIFANTSELPSHIVGIYAIVTWLHLQFHLPRVACHALLAMFASLVAFLVPSAARPQITLKAANRALGLDTPVHILPVCKTCKDIFPATRSTPDSCPKCDTQLWISDRTARGKKRKERVPCIKYPYLSISEQLPSILATAGVETAMDQWRKRKITPGKYDSIFDGKICCTLRAPDGRPFFSNLREEQDRGPNGELRIGLTMGVDWFSYIRSHIAPSHSSCPTSFSICNLPPEFRYRTSNLLLTSILPGPKEQTGDEIQRFLRPIINDLVRLWKDGIRLPTPSCPQGRLVRVALVAVICDKPAAAKMGGFGSHSHSLFCTKCWISQKDKLSPSSFDTEAFPARTDEQQCNLGEQYRQKTSAHARDLFAKEHATRYTELSRLPYFDIVEQVVVDLMHNLFLGLVKTHFYNIWVQGKILREKHELRILHEMLTEFVLPTSCGKLPRDIGTPAGGSLTADQWLLMATVYGPVVVPQLWEACLPDDVGAILDARKKTIASLERKKMDKEAKVAAAKEAKKHKKAAERALKQADSRKRKRSEPTLSLPEESRDLPLEDAPTTLTSGAPLDDDNEQMGIPGPEYFTAEGETEADSAFSLHPGDLQNFLKLSAALTLLSQRSISVHELNRADNLLREYCKELIELYGPSVIKPNHHYATHTADFVRNFGPLHGFWSFVFERLNKVLKSFKANNHSHGDLETTFFQEFQRTCQSSRLTFTLANHGSDSLEHQLANIMTKASSDERGTVASLAAKFVGDNNVADNDAGISYSLSPRNEDRSLSSDTYHLLVHQLNNIFPTHRFHARTEIPRHVSSMPLDPKARFFDYVVVNGQRYHAAASMASAARSLIEVEFRTLAGQTRLEYGELLEIFQYNDGPNDQPLWFGRVQWFMPWDGERTETWSNFPPELDVRLWKLAKYRTYYDSDFSYPFINLTWITGYVARSIISIGETQLWATIPIKKRSKDRCPAHLPPVVLHALPTLRHYRSRSPFHPGVSSLVAEDEHYHQPLMPMCATTLHHHGD